MKTVLIFAAGLWVGKEIFTQLFADQLKERDLKIRNNLERFLNQEQPALSKLELQHTLQSILDPTNTK